MGSVIKILMNIGIIHIENNPLSRYAWETAFKKKRNNERMGIIEATVDFSQKYHKNQ